MKRFNKKTIVIAVVAVLVLAGVVFAVGSGKSDTKKKDETGPKPALAVTTVAIRSQPADLPDSERHGDSLAGSHHRE